MDATRLPSVVFNLATGLLRQRITAEGNHITEPNRDRYLLLDLMSHGTRASQHHFAEMIDELGRQRIMLD